MTETPLSSSPKRWYWHGNPRQILKWVMPLMGPACLLGGFFYVMGSVWGLFFSPPDYLHGDNVRFLYIHVPAAWLSMGIYATLVLCALLSFVYKHPMSDLVAEAAAPVGFFFTTICLVTGALWGQVAWGTPWIWDARLTSVFVLWLLYGGHMILFNAFPDFGQGAKISSFLALLGAINLPIIKWSVDWWNTLHQPASFFRLGKPTVHSAFMGPLLMFALSYIFLSFGLIGLRISTLFYRKKLMICKINRSQNT